MDHNDVRLDAAGAAMKAIQAIELTSQGRTVHPRVGDLTYPEFALGRCTAFKRCTEECPSVCSMKMKRGALRQPLAAEAAESVWEHASAHLSFKDYSPTIFTEMMNSIEMPDEFDEKPRILIFACENDALPVFDMAAMHRLRFNSYVRIIHALSGRGKSGVCLRCTFGGIRRGDVHGLQMVTIISVTSSKAVNFATPGFPRCRRPSNG